MHPVLSRVEANQPESRSLNNQDTDTDPGMNDYDPTRLPSPVNDYDPTRLPSPPLADANMDTGESQQVPDPQS
ncbi:hypothetical protein CY34DRAFT_7286 [Suillus luteus UH-Slu-Lm8-n1]|uniref:Uncharacterized protein n=1 Tax=Suillus luteus UH-Slu-Lm8-n1 TaxID=930992 RepID=A0A0D0C3J9_9AGAM|nr:hypothetical protein CY34DRAFT_7286 [Suillus luteus UH-Slu-Lm8-n1]